MNHVFDCNPNCNTVLAFTHLQMVVYLESMEVWGREDDGRLVLWLVPNIKVLVTVSYVVGKC